MALQGTVNERNWSVSVEVRPHDDGFGCLVHVVHEGPEGRFEHQFKHVDVFDTEHEAVLAGLREGMLWLERKGPKKTNGV